MNTTDTAEALPLVCVMHTDEAKLMSASMRIARQAVVADIQRNANRTKLDDAVWWDTRPMLDPREHAPESLDMVLQALDFALLAGIAVRHQDKPYLLRITTAGMAA